MRWISRYFAFISILLDALLIALGLFLAAWLRPELNNLSFSREVVIRHVPALLYFTFPLIWLLILLLLSVYDDSHYPHLGDKLFILSIGAVLAMFSMAGSLYLSFREVSRLLFLVFVLLGYLFQISWRIAAQRLGFPKTDALRRRRVLITGTGSTGCFLCQHIADHPELGLTFAGFLSSNPSDKEDNPEVLGDISEASTTISQNQIDDVILALPISLHAETGKLVAELQSLPVRVWLAPDYLGMTMQSAGLSDFAGIPMLDLQAPALTSYQRSLKRAFDLTVLLLSLPVTLPLLGLVALVLRLQDSGPVIFSQVRVGENGQLFKMYKFRSMVPEAEKLTHLVDQHDPDGNLLHKVPNDPRVTRLGQFLRRTSLDELPQLLNILRGEMSLVGPRPELPNLVENYQPWQWRRFTVPQGLTGWWQVNGRSDRPMHLNTEDDLFYIRNYSLALDVWILVRTVGAVIRGNGAF